VLQAVALVATPSVAVFRFGHPRGELHVDPDEERSDGLSVNIVESGCFEMEDVGGRFRLSAGDVFVARPGVPLRFRHEDEVPDDVCLSISFLDEPEAAEHAGRPPGRPFPSVRCATNRLRYLHRGLAAAAADEPLAVETQATELLEAVLGPTCPSRPYGARQLRWYAERVDAARDALEKRWEHTLTLTALAREAGMSPFHFARIFRELAGRPPHRYLVEVRLTRAAARLRDGMSVTDTCHASGFRNLSHFVRSFRRRFGVSPSGYARKKA
jgi:AraC-like DNA-binding protein